MTVTSLNCIISTQPPTNNEVACNTPVNLADTDRDSEYLSALQSIVSGFVDLGFGSSAAQIARRSANLNERPQHRSSTTRRDAA